MTTRQGKSGQKLGSRRSVGVLAILLALILLADLLATRGPGLAGAASITPQASPTPVRPLATLPPSATARSATRVAARPTQIQGTPSSTATATPSLTASPEPTVTATPTATATATPTPSPPAPTASATWTSTPALSPSPASSPSPVATTELTEEILTILLIGGDRDYVLDMNTDTLIVAVVNRGTKQVSLLSIPRDLWVYIPTYDWARINVAHRLGARGKYPEGGGPGLLMRTIEENLGISIDHWVRIGYEGFSRAVDELGGVDMVVPCTVNLRYQPPDSVDEQEMILAAGLHHLDGATALRYVRTRRGDSDFERAQRQQQFIKSVWYQFKSPATVLKIPALWTAMQGAFATDLQLGDVLALAPVGLELEPQRVRSLSIGRGQVENWTTPEGSSVLLPIPERIQEVVARLYAPGAAAPAATEAARIQVQNGTGRAQLALIAADRLRWEGLEVVDTGPADRADYARTQIIVFNEKPEALDALTRLLKVRPENVTWQPDAGQAADLRVILGTDYDPCP